MREKNYRPNVAAIILSANSNRDIFLARRSDIKDAWQFPQGGIDSGETPKMALFRELKEEIGTNDIDIIAEYPKWISYDYPSEAFKKAKPKFDGQIQRYFLVKLKDNSSINLPKNDEFDDYKFVEFSEIEKSVRHFKRGVYMEVLNYFIEKGYILC